MSGSWTEEPHEHEDNTLAEIQQLDNDVDRDDDLASVRAGTEGGRDTLDTLALP